VEAQELSSLLQTSGGYGLSVILMTVVAFLWRTIQAKDAKMEEKDERIFGLLDKQNEVLKALERLERKP
jgi:hypothetical protein